MTHGADAGVDILLTHGYFLQEDPAERRIMKPYAPLGILYLSSYLKSRGFRAGVFDSTFSSPSDFRAHIDRVRPPVVGVYVNLMTKLPALELIRYCRSRNATVIVGGPEVPYHAEEFLRHGADIAVSGEGELTLEELLPHLARRGPTGMHHIAGITYRETDGTIVRTAERALIPDLDALPLPDREAIDIPRYLETWKTHHGAGSLSLICARGCPFTCTWCSRSVFGDTHRRRSPKHVADEIALLRERYAPDMLWFADDVFTINHRWLQSFADEMASRNLRIPFECISRADRLNDGVLKTMADLGAYRIWYGSESGSQRILDAMDRRVTVEQIRNVTALARRHGIQSGLFVMLGYDGEEIGDIDATIAHLKESNPDVYLTTVAYPITGTTFHERVRDRLLPAAPWTDRTDRNVNFGGRHSDRFYWFATRHLVNEVALHRLLNGNGTGRGMPASAVLRSPSLLGRAAMTYAKSRLARAGMQLTRSVRT